MKNPEDSDNNPRDRSLRFVFEQTDIRGEIVHLEESFQEILEIHQYAPGVSRLMGECLAAAALLGTTLKFQGKLILQIRSEGEIPLLMVEYTSERQIRAIARDAEQATSDSFDMLLANGQMAITVDPKEGQRYQGIVPLAGGSIQRSLDAYFEQSEQLQTRMWLAADGEQAAGMLLQQLPAQITGDPVERHDQWRHSCALGETIQAQELLELSAEQMLHRLFHEDPLRVFPATGIEFCCSCSRERTYDALVSLGAAEIADILDEQGSVSMDCEFCNRQYIFHPEDLQALLTDSSGRIIH